MSEHPYHPDADAYLAGLARGEVLVQRCPNCAHVQFPPRVRCLACSSARVEMTPVDGRGTVYARTVNRRAPEEAFAALVPYAVAIVDLDAGVRVLARGDGAPESIRTGERVEVYPDPAPPLLPGLLCRPLDTET